MSEIHKDQITSTVDKKINSFYDEDLKNIKSFKRRMSHFHYIRKIARFLKDEEHCALLDIGSGTGSFLYYCEAKFNSVELYGLEYDDRLIRSARNNLERSMISQGNAEKLPYDDEKFDMITSFQVIEHLYAPENMLAEVHRVLKPGGVFLLTTPNLNGLGRRFHKTNWHGFRNDHVSLKGCIDWDVSIRDVGFSRMSYGSTFFSGIVLFQRFPFSIINNSLLASFGWMKWGLGESFVGIYEKKVSQV